MPWIVSVLVAGALVRVLPIGVPTALACVRQWQRAVDDPLGELQRTECLLATTDDQGPRLGCVALVDTDDGMRAIAVFERGDDAIVLRDICSRDRSSGTVLARAISRQATVRTSEHLSARWSIAQRYFKSP